jgi:hypothetical protein
VTSLTATLTSTLADSPSDSPSALSIQEPSMDIAQERLEFEQVFAQHRTALRR